MNELPEKTERGRRRRRIRRGIQGLLVAAWLGSMAWLLRFEAFPEYFTHALAGYRSLLTSDMLVMDSWYIVQFNGTPIGYSRTWVDVREENPREHYVVENLTELELSVLGTRQRVHFDSEAFLDQGHRLQRFMFNTRSGQYRTRIEGTRTTGDRFTVELDTGGSASSFEVRIPDDTVIYSPVTDLALRRLKPGEQVTLKTFNPIVGESVPVRIQAQERESLVLGTNTFDALALTIHSQGMSMNAWVDGEGQLLKQETDLGWTIVRSTFEEATRALRNAHGAPDILRTLAVPCEGSIPEPRRTRFARLHLHGVDFEEGELESPRQFAQRLDASSFLLEVHADNAHIHEAEPLTEDERRAALAGSPYVQVDAPEIRAKAAELTADARTPLERARAIAVWVDENVENVPRVSLPSALDVLKHLEGDCNEHTYLFVALARAAGLPARIMIGIVHHEGAFYYHAWPAVHVGRWIEIDPTFGQFGVDATHVALLEGELRNQMRLTRVFGRLSIEVLETSTESPHVHAH